MSELSLPLAEAADRLLSQRCDSRLVAAADAGQWPQALWQAVEELGPGQLLAPEAEGGAGGDWLDACALLERAAARCAPLPIAQTLLAGWLRSRVGLAPAAGPAAVAFTTAPLDALRAAGRADLTEADGPVVAWADQASHVALLGADDAGTAQLLWLPRACVQVRAVAGGAWPAARVGSAGIPLHAAAGARPTQAWCIALPGLSLAEVRARAALLSAAQIAGALGRLLEMTVTYTGERVQFGRSIGQFQGVQHQLAQLAEEAAAARVAVQAAAATEDPRWFVAAAAAAKARAGEAAGLGTRIAHQLHGAIGVTAEHTLHLYTRRLREWRDEHGSETFWARALVQAIRQGGERSAWQAVVACTSR
ncbi:hypothetical protein APR50_32880 [Variovorax paradoxus]|uniref:acyl-CoA dehydrogenase family protein n=1 Tax=Comamonadaceae TaxID=80864 RepID=UPI0006907966|nr:acyl-CoA dehydrogenase family protein [Xenophilus azovorans]KPU99481.1 hypothetical protein APR52_03405 [Variovorax paradoxus]MBN8746382.1 acyl-CoA dehydrogenase family protein [Variovorax sp.]KPV00402.1 hypothetical protein APR50_32880 [Variovorax paradoxus]KPV07749.1 hypothetical protein APR49_16685 [Variovorax paradoxus]KPV15354.1 hypothetical protein APR51_34840 [Variovorax paradoxus]